MRLTRRLLLGSGLASLWAAGASGQWRTGVVSVREFGAVGDGRADDTRALTHAAAAASARRLPLHLGRAHRISGPIPIAGDLEIIGAHDTLTEFESRAGNHAVFRSNARNVKLSGIATTGLRGIIEVARNFDRIEVSGCDYTGIANRVNNFAILVAKDVSGGEVAIHDNRFRKCTPYFGEGAAVGDLYFDDNLVVDAIRHVVRALDPADPPPQKSMIPTRFYCRRNRIHGINTDFPGRRGQVARFVQLSARESLQIVDNHIENVIGDEGTATVVYWQYGSLTFENNTVVNVRSGGKTGNRIISDKLQPDSAALYRHRIAGNRFDQSSVPADQSPTAIVHFYASHNVIAEGDTFIGCSCPAYRVWQSVDAGTTPSHFVFRNARVRDHRHPVVVSLVQQMSDVLVEGFEVDNLSNPSGISAHGSKRPRLVDCMLSFNNGRALEQVAIRNNTVSNAAPAAVIARIFRHPRALKSSLREISLVGNSISGGAALVGFDRGAPLGWVTLESNSGATDWVGWPPHDLVSRRNRLE